MSRIDELCEFCSESNQTAQTDWNKYTSECEQFASVLVKGLLRYMDLPVNSVVFPGRVNFMGPGTKVDAGRIVYKESSFDVLVTMTLRINRQSDWALVIRLNSSVEKIGSSFSVKTETVQQDIQPDSQDDLETFYKSIYAHIKAAIEDNRRHMAQVGSLGSHVEVEV